MQSSSLAHDESSETAAAAASEAVIGPPGAAGAAGAPAGPGATGAACFPASGVEGACGAAFDGRLAATVVAPGAGPSFVPEAHAQSKRAVVSVRMQRKMSVQIVGRKVHNSR